MSKDIAIQQPRTPPPPDTRKAFRLEIICDPDGKAVQVALIYDEMTGTKGVRIGVVRSETAQQFVDDWKRDPDAAIAAWLSPTDVVNEPAPTP